MMQIRFFVTRPELAPTRAHDDDAGFDLRAAQDCQIYSYRPIKVPTGVHVAIPKGFYGDVRLRSGLASQGVLLASSGVIDSGYRGEILVPMVAVNDAIAIKAGDRVAQIIITAFPAVRFESVTDLFMLGDTERGSGGFGSSGSR